ncbi:MAG: hypothetical protein IJB96_05050 [Lachnospira sp.]|nr:hypothetical protein [Lachnospira sp.]
MSRLFLRKNNKGSTLIIVIVVVALIAILATTTLSAAMLNYRMKIVGSESKKSFYTAEEAVDQLYTCFGMLTMTNLNEAYKNQMATITRQDASGASYLVSNEKCNTELRSKFASDTVQDLFGVSTWAPKYPADKEISNISVDTPEVVGNVRNLMNSYIEDYDASNPIISVKSVGACRVVEQKSDRYDNLYNYWVEIDNVAIEYKNEQGYFANVTVDANIGLPDLLIAFTDVSDASLVTFGDYTIIGCDGVQINPGFNLTLSNGKLYAGDTAESEGGLGGFRLNTNSKFTAAGISTVNTPGNIIIDGRGSSATNGTTYTMQALSKLFCNNITTTQDSTWGTVNLAGSAFVKDDMDINGSNNIVNLNGNYVGFSSGGVHGDSSAIMLNGTYCTLNMTNMKSLVLGGRSYLRIPTGTNTNEYYQLGESVSLRATQETYLVPDAFIKGKDTYADRYFTNPVAATYSSNTEVVIPDGFFAKDLLVSTQPVKEITSGGFTYYYLNIAENKHAEYISRIVNYNAASGVDVHIESLRRVLFADIIELQQQSLLNTEGTSMIYTAGAMIHTALNNDINTVDSIKAMQLGIVDNYSTLAADVSSRYILANKVLYEPKFFMDESKILDGSKALNEYERNPLATVPGTISKDGKNIDISTMTDSFAQVFTNFIDVVELTRLASTAAFQCTGDDNFKVYCAKQKMGENLVISLRDLGITTGLIITDGDVIMDNGDFNGLIFARGTVTVNGTLVANNTYGGIDNMLSKLTADDRKIVQALFKSWNATDTTESENALDYNIAGITYKHIIDFNNWRKSAPTVIDGEETTTAASPAEEAPAAGFEPGVTK